MILYISDCDRYAMKREVAAETGRFFRGVCPILNRAKEYFFERLAYTLFELSECGVELRSDFLMT